MSEHKGAQVASDRAAVVMPTDEFVNDSARVCADGLRRHGYTLVNRVLSEPVVADLNEEFRRRYADCLGPGATFDNSLKTGDLRYMLTVELSGAFADTSVYANQSIMKILNLVFDQDFILESFGVVLSLPGAKSQNTHRDGKFLFNAGVASILPSYAVTVGIPLIDMSLEQGTTEVFPGSHRPTHWDESSLPATPNVPAGSAIMWDFRTLHRGTENRSARYRPLLYMTYSKPWWRDLTNFEVRWEESGPIKPQKRILFGREFFRFLPVDKRFLFRNLDVL